MKTATSYLRRAFAIERTDPAGALSLLDEGIGAAREAGESEGVASLARHAAVLAENLGDPERALELYRLVSGTLPTDVHVCVAMADLCERQGRHDDARELIGRARRFAEESGDADLVELAQAATRRLDHGNDE